MWFTIVTYLIGFLAQAFFSARILVQWVMSEKQRQIVTPAFYWIFSLMGSILLFIYGGLRSDFSILLGQTLSYYIYIWNLNLQGHWTQLRPALLRYFLIAVPFIAATFLVRHADGFFQQLFQNSSIPLWLLLLGSIGQCTFSFRFIYQWAYSYRHKESSLPRGFWIISLTGSSLIILYAIIRLDPVLILGQSFGFLAYIRNLMIDRKSRKSTTQK